MILPTWLNYPECEKTAMSLVRGLRGRSGDWGRLIASAQATIGCFQDLHTEQVSDLHVESEALPLVAASRILDAASSQQSGLGIEEREKLAWLAATAYAMCGNFPSSAAILRRLIPPGRELSPPLIPLVGTISPKHVPALLNRCGKGSVEHDYLTELDSFHHDGSESSFERSRELLVECLLGCETPAERNLYRSARIALYQNYHLSVVKALRNTSHQFPHNYVTQLVKSGLRLLLPPQYRAISISRMLDLGNLIVALPTSSGKTFLGELLLVAALNNGPGLSVYVAPYVDLGKQISDVLSAHLPPNYRLHRCIGGFRQSELLDPASHREVVVATPERLDAMLRMSPSLYDHVKCVVVDEAHMIQNDSRGVRLEGLLTRLRMKQDDGSKFKIILLSAVLSAYNKLSHWLGIADPDGIVADTWKPTARRIATWRQDGRVVWHVGDDPIRPKGMTSSSNVGEFDLPWPESNFYSSRNFGLNAKQEEKVNVNVAYLCELLWERYQGPILCVCSTKAKSRRLAHAVARRFPNLEPIPELVSRAIRLIETKHRYLLPLAGLLRGGVVYHNAAVPHDLRRLIFDAIQGDEIKVTAATTTLAEGVDLPFRFSVIVDWLMWQGSESKPMSPLLFRNIAGRCGRAGVFTEGDTILFDNPVGDPAYTARWKRTSLQESLFLSERAGEVTSALDAVKIRRDDPLYSELASQVLASIPENPDADPLEDRFFSHSFVAFGSPNPLILKNALLSIRNDLLDDSKGALARAASPLQLTPFGVSANASGFSPASCRMIVDCLAPLGEELVGSASRMASHLLEKLGTIPEQTNINLKKILTSDKAKFCVRADDLQQVVEAWLSGSSREEIFAGLPSVRRSSIKPEVDVWVAGTDSALKWEERFDGFVDFTNFVFRSFLPWLLRACGRLAEVAGGSALEPPWAHWADLIEEGVDTDWALEAIRQQAPSDRWAKAVVGRAWPPSANKQSDPLGLSIFRLPGGRARVDALFSSLIQQSSPTRTRSPQQLTDLQDWILQKLAGA